MCSETDQVVAVPGAVAAGTTYKIGRARLPGAREVADLPTAAVLGASKHVMSRTQLAVWLSFPSRHYTAWTRNQGYLLLLGAALVHLVVSLVIAMGQDPQWGEVLLAPFCLTGLFWGFGLLNVLGARGARRRDAQEAPARSRPWPCGSASTTARATTSSTSPGWASRSIRARRASTSSASAPAAESGAQASPCSSATSRTQTARPSMACSSSSSSG